MLHRVPLSLFDSGLILDHPLRDKHDNVVLGPRVPVSDEVLERLWERGVRALLVHQDDLAQLRAFRANGESRTVPPNREHVRSSLRTLTARRLDDEIDRGESLRCDIQMGKRRIQVDPQTTTPYDPHYRRELYDIHQRSLSMLEGVFSDLRQGQTANLQPIESVARNGVAHIGPDVDLFVCLGINPQSTNYPVRHSLHVALLAGALGANLGLDENTLVELMSGCLVHDLGMLRLAPDAYLNPHILDADQFREITHHPVHAVEMLKDHTQELPPSVRIIAYQMHERLDGSGYPRGRSGEDVHDLARIAAVADAYVALVSDRPHRAALLPYYAMEKLLQDTQQELYDVRVLRGLLSTVSLFPIGSCIALNDGRVGRVLRARENHFDRPIVELWDPDRLYAKPALVNLVDHPQLKVQRAIPALRAA